METVTELSLVHRWQLLRHFLALDGEDRRLRFGVALRPDDDAYPAQAGHAHRHGERRGERLARAAAGGRGEPFRRAVRAAGGSFRLCAEATCGRHTACTSSREA